MAINMRILIHGKLELVKSGMRSILKGVLTYWTKSTISPRAKKPLLKQTIKDSIGMDFVLIPVGSFMMDGNPSPEETTQKYGVNQNCLNTSIHQRTKSK